MTMTWVLSTTLLVLAIRGAQSEALCAAPPSGGSDEFMSSGRNAGHGGCSGPPPPGAADDGWVYPGTEPVVEEDVASPKKAAAPQHVGHGIDDDAVAAGLGKDERDARDVQFKQWETKMQDQASDDDLDAEERWEQIKHWGLCGGAGVLLALALNAMKSSGRATPPTPVAAVEKKAASKTAAKAKGGKATAAATTDAKATKAVVSGGASSSPGASKSAPSKKSTAAKRPSSATKTADAAAKTEAAALPPPSKKKKKKRTRKAD